MLNQKTMIYKKCHYNIKNIHFIKRLQNLYYLYYNEFFYKSLIIIEPFEIMLGL